VPLWGKVNQQSSAPKFRVVENNRITTTSRNVARGTNSAFNNTSPGVFHRRQSVGVFGANSTDVHASSRKDISHTGWHLVRIGTGPVATLTISVGGTGYSNTDTVKVAVTGNGSINASATLVTNATGGITTVTITNAGRGFTNAASGTVSFANSTSGASAGSGATLTITLGGRAGRKHYECLVAGSITGSPPATLP